MSKVPALFPLFVDGASSVIDGDLLKLSSYCKRAFDSDSTCRDHYQSLVGRRTGWYECPFGLSCRSFVHDGALHVFTGMIAHPRFGSENERRRSKELSGVKASRDAVDQVVSFIDSIAEVKSRAIAESSKVLPQAFHELRKLNGNVLQHAEKEIQERGETRSLVSIRSAAEIMRNNFDILEALANMDVMRALPLDSTVNLYDLTFKMKRVLQERAASRGISIHVNGVRAIISGSQKSFPLVPAVLIENAIRHGIEGGKVFADIEASEGAAILRVQNNTLGTIDPVRCFDRGTRYSSSTEGGGYGLYLAKEVVESHRGTIRCEVDDRSVSMIVTLPLKTVIPAR